MLASALLVGLMASAGIFAPAPTATANPVIVSNLVQGVPMAVVLPSTTGNVSSWTYQWNKAGSPIAGATSATYAAPAGDVQATTITCSCTPFNGTTAGNTVTSAARVVAPAPLGATSANYTSALAAVTDGQYFSHFNAGSTRIRIYQRQAGVGVLVDVTAPTGTLNQAWAAVQGGPKMQTAALVEFDSASTFFGEREFQGLQAGVGPRTLNLLGHYTHAKTGYKSQGTLTVIPRVADSNGGTLATELQFTTTSAAATDIYWTTRVPPGTWTFAVDVVGLVSGSQNVRIGYNGTGTTVLGQAVQGTPTTITQTFNLTAETALNVMVLNGDYPSAPAQSYDFRIENLRLVPGTSAATPSGTDTHPAVFTNTDLGYNGVMLESATLGANDGNMLTAKFATLKNLTGWTMHSVLKGTLQTSVTNTGVVSQILKSDMTGTAYLDASYISDTTDTPNAAQVYTKIGSAGVRDTTWQGMGLIVYDFVAHTGAAPTAGVQTGVDVYMNGLFIENIQGGTINVGTQANSAGVAFNSLATVGSSASGGGTYSIVGDVAAGAFFGTALAQAQITDAYNVSAARAAAKGLAIQPITTVGMPTGDSIDFGLADGGPWGYVNRSYSGLTTPAGYGIPVAMQAHTGDALGDYVLRLNATVTNAGYLGILAQVQQLVAAGVRVIVTVKIGTNDGGSLINQAAVESYYNANYASTGCSLKQIWAALRAAGAKVVAITHIPGNAFPVHESGTGATTTTAGSGTGVITATAVSVAAGLNGQSFVGWRAYLNALIRSDQTLYDALCDFANESHVAGTWLTCNSGGGGAAAIYQDTLHPKPVLNAFLAVLYKAAVSPFVV